MQKEFFGRKTNFLSFLSVETRENRTERKDLPSCPASSGSSASRVCDAQQGSDVEREQPGLSTGLWGTSDAGIGKELPDRVPGETSELFGEVEEAED